MKRKLLLLFALMAIGLTHSWAYDFSAVSPNGQTLYYNFNGSSLTVSVTYPGSGVESRSYVGFTKPSGSLQIPSNVNYGGQIYSVTAIGHYAFYNCSDLANVTIPNTVTSIGNSAFELCTSMSGATIPNSVVAIGENAFCNCSSLTGIVIPNRLASIEMGTFSGCTNLTGVTIPNSVTNIGYFAFYDCRRLTSISIESEVAPSIDPTDFYTFFNVPTNIPVYVPCGMVSAYQIANGWNRFTNIQEDPSCPQYNLYYTFHGTSATVYGDYAFGRVTIANSGTGEEIDIPSLVTHNGTTYSVTRIGEDAFSYSSSLTSVNIPNTVTTIENDAFRDCTHLASATIGNSVTSIEEDAFYNCRDLTSVNIPNSVTSIGANAFRACSRLTNIALPSSVTSIGSDAFAGSGLTDVTLPNSLTNIPEGAFYGCSNLTNVTIPNSVTNITDYAFYDCNSLISVSIPSSVRYIGEGTFSFCSGLTSLTIEADVVPNIGDGAFYGVQTNVPVYVPCGKVLVYQAASEWGQFTNIQENPACLPHYDLYYSFNGTSATVYGSAASGRVDITNIGTVEEIDIPGSVTYNGITYSVTSIGNAAFQGCSGLTNVTIPNSVTSIGDNAFSACSGLTSVTIPNSVTSIGYNAFYGCTSLTRVTIPNSVAAIGDYAFRNTSLYNNSDNWTNGVLYIDNCLIEVKSNELSSVYSIANNTKLIADYAFYGCTSLTRVTIPNSVTFIGNGAFASCSGLTSVTIPNSVTSIGVIAFWGCRGLTVFDLSNISDFTRTSHGTVKRVVKCSNHGAGENAIHQIPNTFSVVNSEDDVENHIPSSLIPDNFIYKNGDNWKAKHIVLVDDTCRFFSPVAFTADQVTYTRDLTDGNRSTLCLPFSADKPAGLDVYTFAGFGNSIEASAGTIRFQELQGSELTAYTPYLVGKNLSKSTTKFTFSKQHAVFPATPSPIATSTINGLTFHGTMNRECMNSSNYGYKDGYFVQSSAGTQGDHTSHAHVNPFRCYFTLGGSQSAPATLSVDTDGDYLGIEDVDSDMEQTSIRYSNDVYDMMGRLVRKDADNLRGLPRGIYIWRGKKQIAY